MIQTKSQKCYVRKSESQVTTNKLINVLAVLCFFAFGKKVVRLLECRYENYLSAFHHTAFSLRKTTFNINFVFRPTHMHFSLD